MTAYHNFMGGTPSTHIVNAPDSVTVYDGSVNTVAATTFAYDAGSPASSGAINLVAAPGLRGNPTSVAKWVGGSNWLTTNYAWFDDGQLAQATDPAGDTTSYGYNDAWASGSSPGQTHAYPTLITDALGHTRSYTWNYAGGELATAKDDNGQTTSFTYNDPLLRLTQTNFPDGGETTAAYSDAPGAVAIEVRRLISGSSWTDAWTYFDGLGHAVTQCSANGEAVPWDRVDTTYDGEGHRSFVAYLYQAPNCTSANNEPGDSFAFDALGRATQVTHSDGNSILTSYTGAATELQDEGNGTSRVARISQADGLDRVISVCEVTSASLPGNGGTPAACNLDIAATGFLTNYGYSALGDLTSVAQAGLNNRTFAYDGLSRLTSAANPESGAIQYTYDVAACGAPASAGDLTCRTDARGITTAYSYDHLHRLTQKAYSDGTPTVSYGYDQTSIWGWTLHNTVGRLSYAGTSSASGGFFDYDPMGRVAIRGRCTPSTCGTGGYVYSYSYDSAGDVVASQMEQSATIDIAYNQALRPTGETSSLNDGNHPGTLFSLAHYNARGELLSATLGNGLSEARGYDARGRLTSLAAGAAYSTGATYAPDGDVTASTDSANGNWSYGYDALNRLISAAGNGVTIGYGYDRFGNMWQHTISPAPSPAPPTLSFDANNRIVGASYDAAGDLLTDPVTGCRFSYDAAQRITGVAGCATASYAYNAQGQREHTVVNGVTREYVSGRAGESRTVFAGQSQLVEGNVYVGGRDLATYAGGTTYFDHGDGLGTVRARSNLSGGVVEAYSSLPYGGWLNQVGTVSALHFTGKQFDGETSLTYFPARFQSGYSGRFMTPDWSARPEAVPYANVGNPQSLNLYLYTLDNPVTNTDADGHICIFGIGNTCHPDPKAPPPPPPPLALPIAQLHTSTRGGYTVFQWSDKSGGYHEDKVRSLVKADHRSKPGAAGPIESYVVGQIQGLTSPKYGPAGAQIDTGDSRDRWIHGGGSSLADPYAPHQILTPTFGCTRACNADVQRLGREITIFQKLNPEMPIPYSRTDQ